MIVKKNILLRETLRLDDPLSAKMHETKKENTTEMMRNKMQLNVLSDKLTEVTF